MARYSAEEALNIIFSVPGDGLDSDLSDFSGDEGVLSDDESDDDFNTHDDMHAASSDSASDDEQMAAQSNFSKNVKKI